MITCIYHMAVISPGVIRGRERPYKCRARIRLFESHWGERKIAGCIPQESILTLLWVFCPCSRSGVGRCATSAMPRDLGPARDLDEVPKCLSEAIVDAYTWKK